MSPAQLRLVRGWLGDRARPLRRRRSRSGDLLVRRRRPHRSSPLPTHCSRARAWCTSTRNYRSTPEIVAAAEALLADGGLRRAGRDAVQGEGPVPVITDYDTEGDEAEARGAQDPGDAHTAACRWSEFAVLYRINAQSAAFEEALAAEGIPFRVRGEAGSSTARGASAVLDRPPTRPTPPLREVPLTAHLHDLELHDPAKADETRRATARNARARRRRRAPRSRVRRHRSPAARSTGSSPSSATLAQRRAVARRRRGRAAHVPPRQGPRVPHRARDRARAWAGADRPRRGPGRSAPRSGACSTSRSHAPRSTLDLCVGAQAHARVAGDEPGREPVARADRGRVHATRRGHADRAARGSRCTRRARRAPAIGSPEAPTTRTSRIPSCSPRSSSGGGPWPEPRRCPPT